MIHLTVLSKNPIYDKIIKPTRKPLLYLQLFLSLIMNIIVLFTMARVFNIDDSKTTPVPIPGISDPSQFPLSVDFTDAVSGIVFDTVGYCILLLLFLRCLLHLGFDLPLRVRRNFPSSSIHEKWTDLRRDKPVWFWQQVIWILITDIEMWTMIFMFVVTLVAIIVAPSIVSLQTLFEVIALSVTIQKYLKSLWVYRRNIFLIGLLLLTNVFFFCVTIFYFFNDWYFITQWEGRPENPTGRLYFCDTMFKCFGYTIVYLLRAMGSVEQLSPVILTKLTPLTLLHWVHRNLFFIISNVVLLKIFLGIILESFADIRAEKSEIQRDVEEKCFICDIEKTRFDIRADVGINFEKHRSKEHHVWHYVSYFIYLLDKPSTEYTGIEQYLADLIKSETPDLSFFPCLRSLVLEKDEKKRVPN
jgi:hypothetical protein